MSICRLKWIMLTLERGFYRLVIVPLVAFLPAPVAYGVACLRGDWCYRWDSSKREEVMRCLEGVLGDQLSSEVCARVTRDVFRQRSCQAVDVTRLAGKGRMLARLVEIRGLEHIETALVAGKGAIIASAHFGSLDSCFSLIGVHGFPITVIGRWGRWSSNFGQSIQRFFFQLLVQKPVEHHRHQPDIQPWGQFDTAFQAAAILRKNALIGVCLDAPVLPADRRRAVSMDFLNGQALLLPGAITIAQLTGAPVLMAFMRRAVDWRHQILEISPPMALDGDTMTTFKCCLAVVEEAIRQDPAYWNFWYGLSNLVQLGLLSEETIKAHELVARD
jgi:lauroyl/myristoyl acyltransferase